MMVPPFPLPELAGTHVRFAPLPKEPAWIGGAVFSDEVAASGEPLYRYILTRHLETPCFANDRVLVAAMLNPSKATHIAPDNTVTRMRNAAFSLGFNALVVVNMFALRSTKPVGLTKVADPVGPQNDAALRWAAELARSTSSPVVCGWGVTVAERPEWLSRAKAVTHVLAASEGLSFWRLTAGGFPQHPLYLPNPLTPFPWLVERDYRTT